MNILTPNAAESSEKEPTAQQTGKLTSPLPLKDGDMGVTQWSPLSLSEIPLSTVDASCTDLAATEVASNSRTPEQPQYEFNCGQLVRQRIEVPHTGFIKKKRKFIYTVESSKLQVQGEDTPKSPKLESLSGIPGSGNTLLAHVKKKHLRYIIFYTDRGKVLLCLLTEFIFFVIVFCFRARCKCD